MDEQEKYYAAKNREREAHSQAVTNAELAKYGPILIIIMIAVLAIYILLLAAMSPGVLLAYIIFRISGNGISPLSMWLIAALTSGGVAYYLYSKYKDVKKFYIAYGIAAAICSVLMCIQIVADDSGLNIWNAMWFFRSGPIASTSSNNYSTAKYEIQTTATQNEKLKTLDVEKCSETDIHAHVIQEFNNSTRKRLSDKNINNASFPSFSLINIKDDSFIDGKRSCAAELTAKFDSTFINNLSKIVVNDDIKNDVLIRWQIKLGIQDSALHQKLGILKEQYLKSNDFEMISLIDKLSIQKDFSINLDAKIKDLFSTIKIIQTDVASMPFRFQISNISESQSSITPFWSLTGQEALESVIIFEQVYRDSLKSRI